MQIVGALACHSIFRRAVRQTNHSRMGARPGRIDRTVVLKALLSTADLLSRPPTLVSVRLFGNRRRQVCKVKSLYPKRRHVGAANVKVTYSIRCAIDFLRSTT